MSAAGARLYLIDAPMYVFRAYHALPSTITDRRGRPTRAVYGYTEFLCKLLAAVRPDLIAAAFDESLVSSFRNALYAEYKANRVLPPAELERQFAWCREATEGLGVACYSSETYEAEDLLASIARKSRPRGWRMVFVSGDKDLAQLLRPGDVLWDYAQARRIPCNGVRRRFGVRPAQIPDLLALVGDSVDNIPGVPGVGHTTAQRLLARFGDLDRLYRGLGRLEAAGLRARLEAHREQAFLSRRLATIYDRARVRAAPRVLRWRGVDGAALDRLAGRLGFGARLRRRYSALVG